MKIRTDTKGPFGEWLYKRMVSHGVMVYELAEVLHTSAKTIYNHLKNKFNPTFSHVVMYCWYFNRYFDEQDDPIDIWEELIKGG